MQHAKIKTYLLFSFDEIITETINAFTNLSIFNKHDFFYFSLKFFSIKVIHMGNISIVSLNDVKILLCTIHRWHPKQ